ncbi:MAG: tRNA (guanosine(37)-N1)-methyltransferase TrmD [Thermacetogeniaceae bacterium]
MTFTVITIFPEMFTSPLQTSILKRAQELELIKVNVVDLRNYSQNKHRKVDDYPYGGGAGMVMKPEPFFSCIEDIARNKKVHTVLLSPQGKVFNQKKAQELAKHEEIILICGHYEGIDERVTSLATEEISIGDFILTGGELAALIIIDSVARLIPGVVGTVTSLEEESFALGILEYPQYTRPRSFRGMDVPEILLSGDHQAIARWRRSQAVIRTFLRRPELLREGSWDEGDRKTITEFFLTE